MLHHHTCCIFSYSIFFIPEKRFLALGFGGQVNGRVSHCFPLNGNSRDPYCRGIEGVVDAYYESLRHGKYINIMPLKKLKAIQFQKWLEILTPQCVSLENNFLRSNQKRKAPNHANYLKFILMAEAMRKKEFKNSNFGGKSSELLIQCRFPNKFDFS